MRHDTHVKLLLVSNILILLCHGATIQPVAVTVKPNGTASAPSAPSSGGSSQQTTALPRNTAGPSSPVGSLQDTSSTISSLQGTSKITTEKPTVKPAVGETRTTIPNALNTTVLPSQSVTTSIPAATNAGSNIVTALGIPSQSSTAASVNLAAGEPTGSLTVTTEKVLPIIGVEEPWPINNPTRASPPAGLPWENPAIQNAVQNPSQGQHMPWEGKAPDQPAFSPLQQGI